jgi:hypothetical protein
LAIPNFPETPEDAADLLNLVRSSREECNHRKLAVELAVHQIAIQLKVLQRKSFSDSSVATTTNDLQALQQELSELDEELMNADEEVGVIRGLINRKGLPVEFYPEALYDRRNLPLRPDSMFEDNGSASTSSDGGTNIVSDPDIEVE